MEELSIKQKAQRYDEALEKANTAYKDEDRHLKAALERIFPELKESEDERIRSIIKNSLKVYFEGNLAEDANDTDYAECLFWLEKQGEQKLADKVEPKFHDGDWIVFNNNHNSIYQVEKIENYHYVLRHILGGSVSIPFGNINLIRPWTIEDAKDGDILADDVGIIVFRKIGNSKYVDVVDYHCVVLHRSKKLEIQTGIKFWGKTEDAQLHPATKEQRDTLKKAIADAGYTFDFNKKELKKL